MSDKRDEFVGAVSQIARLHGANPKRFAKLFEVKLDSFMGKAPKKVEPPAPAKAPAPAVKFGDSDA